MPVNRERQHSGPARLILAVRIPGMGDNNRKGRDHPIYAVKSFAEPLLRGKLGWEIIMQEVANQSASQWQAFVMRRRKEVDVAETARVRGRAMGDAKVALLPGHARSRGGAQDARGITR